MFSLLIILMFLSEQVSAQTANDKLAACCAHDPQIDPGCASKYCNFGNINQFMNVLPLCRAFCDASKAVPTDMLKYGFCTAEFDKYRLCFRTHLKHHKAIRS
ncbi:hypothetical protein GCK72_005880 [Caenorhabditis remanei]|uniref:Domain of unknown function DB domain-containing protein n=1 Tax=Caenorhabditis remanei TaxID=31234 RepID=A0A6A5HGH8_CAERE|nr:hypothetical protein GCK72_005880 [Caenorhabditis remanei]KAF1765927.1 hypothetical protein GCK72_005880 [Caenorhabditis remanei]